VLSAYTLQNKFWHGAQPYETKDSVIAATHLVQGMDLYHNG